MDAHEPGRQPPDWLELRQLRYFLAVAEELNFTRAAGRLHLAQQALSAAIHKLEADLGAQLFTRSTRHVALTAAGEALVAGARHVLQSAAEALDEVTRVGSGQSARLIVGFSTAAGAVPQVRDVIRRFSQQSPDVDLRLVEHDFADPAAGLTRAGSQVAFVFGPLTDDRLESLTIFEDPRHVALPADHPLAQRSEVNAADLTGLRWLRVPAPDSAWTRFGSSIRSVRLSPGWRSARRTSGSPPSKPAAGSPTPCRPSWRTSRTHRSSPSRWQISSPVPSCWRGGRPRPHRRGLRRIGPGGLSPHSQATVVSPAEAGVSPGVTQASELDVNPAVPRNPTRAA